MDWKTIIEAITTGIEVFGVLVIVVGIVFASVVFIKSSLKKEAEAFESYRTSLGKSILLGLELLVAADIVDTVAIKPTMDSVLILGLIVIIRTFLSFSLEIELEGKLPWRRKNSSS